MTDDPIATKVNTGSAAGWRIPVLIMLACLAAVISVGVYVRWRSMHKTEEAPTDPPLVNVSVVTVGLIPSLSDTMIEPAVAEANRVVDISAEVSGRIEEIHCVEGNECKAGDLLITLNTDLLEAEFNRAKAQAEYDETDYQRIASLEAEGAATKKQVDEALAHVKISRAAMAFAKAQFERGTIVSPISGILNKVPVEKGEYVQPGTRVARIVDIDTVKIVVAIPEPDIAFIKKGDEAAIIFKNSEQERETTGTVSYISELSDARTRVTRVEIKLDNSDRILRSGQVVKARFTRQVLEDVIMVPLQAIIPLETGYRVYVIEDEKAIARLVRTSRLMKQLDNRVDCIQVIEGLAPGDRLIIKGHRFVGDGQIVRIEEQSGALEGARPRGKLGK